MFFVYMDDSGDEKVRCFSAIVIHESVWKEAQARLKQFRRALKISDGMYVTKELHATNFVAGRGQVGTKIVAKGRRCEIFRQVLGLVADLPKVRMFNAIGSRKDERIIFERLVNRINMAVEGWKSNAIIFHDEGKDYTSLIRRLCVYNPIRSKFGTWSDGSVMKNFPLNHILEDIVFRDSRQSPFIQMADFCAYGLFRSEYPLASKTKYGLDKAFDVLGGICVQRAFARDHRGLGIIRT